MTAASAKPVSPPAGDSPYLRTDTLAQSVFWLLGLTVAQRLVGFLRGVLFCRWLDAEALGQWDLAFSFLMLAAPIAVWGLPGSFGRYLEYFRQRGRLRTFLRRTTLASLGLGAIGVAVVVEWRETFSRWIFAQPGLGTVVLWIAVTLAVVIAYNFLVSLFTALRMFRLASLMQFVNTVAFAVAAGVLFLVGRVSTEGVVLAYGLGCLVATLWPLARLRAIWRDLPADQVTASGQAFWKRLLPFALWMWTINWLVNLFELVDRYLLLHQSGLPSSAALELVGQYHSARVVPLVIYSIATMVASTLTPHLSHDWEAGRRTAVATRLRLMLKVQSLLLTAAGVAVLAGADLLFGTAFGGKFAQGRAVLPLTLTYCVWAGLGEIALNYLWLRERAWQGSLALLVGLGANVALNLSLVPAYGLAGAVLGTLTAKGLVMLLIVACARWEGLPLDWPLVLILLLPGALCGGPWVAAGLWLSVAALILASPRWLSADERRLANDFQNRVRDRWRAWRGHPAEYSVAHVSAT